MLKRLSMILTLALPVSSWAAVLGDFSQIRHLPGYLETNPQSGFYQGAASKKHFEDGVERRNASQIIVEFFNDQTIDPKKVQPYLDQVASYLKASYAIECLNEKQSKDLRDCDVDVEFQKSWNKNASTIALNMIRENLTYVLQNRASLRLSEINDPKNAVTLHRLYSALDLWESVRAEDEQRSRLPPTIRNIIRVPHLIEKTYTLNEGRIEASNLLVPEGHPLYGKQLFLSEENLAEMKLKGHDLSLLQPPSSPMWRQSKKSIRLFDTSNYDGQGLGQLRKLYPEAEVQAIVNPDQEISVIYKPQNFTGGETPKFDVLYSKIKWKMKFITNRHEGAGSKNIMTSFVKTIWGSEVNVETAANNLAAALGYTVDPTYYKKKIRVYFEDKVYKKDGFKKAHEEMMNELDIRYPRAVNTRTALSVVKKDETGRSYIELKSVALEQKSHKETDMNVGFFDRIGMGRDLMREHRAFFFFLAWIGDPDVKNDNDKTKIVPTSDGWKVAHSNSDMGGAFGIGYPNIYNFPLVNKVLRDHEGNVKELRMNFYRIFDFPMKDVATLNDAKWFARRLGQLSFEQLESAFSHAGYPTVVARYYALLAARKRNELISALDLMGTTFKNEQGETVKLEPLPEFNCTIEGYEEFFKDGFLTDPENKLFNPETENWPRHWGVKMRLFSQDEEVDHKLRVSLRNSILSTVLRLSHNLLDRSLINKQGPFSFMNARIIDHELGDACKDDCFVQALDYGVRNFVPMRFLIDNPKANEDPEHPLWVVDLMRIGVFVGESGEMLQKLIGFDAPESTRTALGSRVYKIFEIIKISPVRGIEDYFSDLKNFSQLPRYALPKLRDQLIDGLQKNESLIVSNYFGLETQGRMKATMPLLAISGIRAGVNNVRTNRVTIHKTENEFLVNWDKNRSTTANFGVNLIDILFKIPLVNQKWTAMTQKENTYVFKDNDAEKSVFVNHLGKSKDGESLEPYRWEYRKEKSTIREFKAGVPLLRTYRRQLTKSTTHYKNFHDQFETKYRKVDLDVDKTRIKGAVDHATFTKSAEILLHDSGKVAVSIDTNLDYPIATSTEMAKLLKRERSYYPESLFSFDLEQMKHYMGKVQGTSRIIFTQEMLEKIFSDSWTQQSICKAFPDTGCSSKFFSLYSNARESFKHIHDEGFDVKTRHLKKAVRILINQKYRNHDFLGFAKVVVGQKNLIEDAQIKSALAAFPGDNDSIAYQKNDGLLKTFSFEGLFRKPLLFTDAIHDALHLIFFAP